MEHDNDFKKGEVKRGHQGREAALQGTGRLSGISGLWRRACDLICKTVLSR